MRAIFIVPLHEKSKLFAELVASERNEDSAGAFILERANEPLDHRDAAVPADGPESRADALLPAPPLVTATPELRGASGSGASGSALEIENRDCG